MKNIMIKKLGRSSLTFFMGIFFLDLLFFTSIQAQAGLFSLDKEPSHQLIEAIKKNDKQKLLKILTDPQQVKQIDFNRPNKNLKYGNDFFDTIFNFSIKYSSKEMVSLLLKYAPIQIEAKSSDNVSPLFLSLKLKKKEMTQLMIDYGANIFALDSEGRNTLYYSFINGWDDLSQYLLEKKVNPNHLMNFYDGEKIKTKEPIPLLHYLILMKKLKDTQLLLQFPDTNISIQVNQQSAINLAIIHTDMDFLNLLLSKGVNIELKDQVGNTPLLTALKLGRQPMAKKLLELGANVFVKDHKNITPLVVATYNFHTELIEYFLNHRLNPNLMMNVTFKPDKEHPQSYSMTLPLISYVIKMKRPHLLETFLNHQGININLRDDQGNLPLTIALISNDEASALKLVHQGSIIDPQSIKIARDKKFAEITKYFNYRLVKEKSNQQILQDITLINHSQSLQQFISKLESQTDSQGAYLYFLKEHFLSLVSRMDDLKSLNILENYLKEGKINLSPDESQVMRDKKEKIVLNEQRKLLGVTDSCQERKIIDTPNCILCNEIVKILPDEKANLGPADCDCTLCSECTEEYLNFEWKNNFSGLIKCPGKDCRQEISLNFLRRNDLGQNYFIKFQKRIFAQKLKEKFSWKACFNHDCPYGNFKTNPADNYLQCPVCLFDGCLECGKNHLGHDCEEYKKNHLFIQFLLKEGNEAPPQEGHPDEESHPQFYKGRYRPCYYCGTITEKVINGFQDNGQCNSMICGNPQCGKKWHFNYGDHQFHPSIRQHGGTDMHDFKREPKMYEPLVPAHF